jgi:predicted 2-oxoglutarate/Fe(II)-dependent dioxygenase YbiX
MTGDIVAEPVGYGEFARLFTGALDVNPTFGFGSVGGRWIVLQFLVRLDAPLAREAHQEILASADLFDDQDACYFGVSVEPDDFAAGPRTTLPGRRYFQDFDQAITKLYGLKIPGGYKPMTILLDRSMRVVAAEPIRRTAHVLDLMRRCIEEERPTLADRFAPVLTVPRIFEPSFCKRLIDYYENDGGAPSGFMRQIDGKTVGIHDLTFKRRRDATINDEDLRAQAVARINRRLLPAIEQAFNWRGTRIERHIVACYSAEDRGFFNRHRDNTTPATAHRRFAVSINLNAEEFEGGELRFPEFGPRTYKPPTGGATVFGCGLLHEATPVTRGVRYAFLPFLYDEESKLIRDRNADTIKWDEPAKVEG